MGPPRRIAEKCFSIAVENYESRDSVNDGGVKTDDSGMTTDDDNEIKMDNSVMKMEGDGMKTENEETETEDRWIASDYQGNQSHVDFSDSDTTSSKLPEQWISPEYPELCENWNTDWTPLEINTPVMEVERHRIWAITADYVDQGLPVGEFLLKYPENYGSSAEGLWSELPGYTVGRIGFMMLLSWKGTEGYLKNHSNWPEDWWTLHRQRASLYSGSGEGRNFVANEKAWEAVRDRKDEEEHFLAGVVAKMVGIFGKFDWEAFKWSLKDEQNRLGEYYRTFWKDWEYSAFED
ncbi:hypothetical protein PSTG_17096 [Puccinia striiformis f. sp. tritici PST-78]|uniref:Uncharacterized protein n=1 Tax=Puccinia striiformis f. sp. tritici PST-78 TaxID=1165861 RepID=A0A0L0UQW1_9BASI|nr:hypothetical protein PSTG_17096 [Puccinia striiformis f. sp. tritici PST-78]